MTRQLHFLGIPKTNCISNKSQLFKDVVFLFLCLYEFTLEKMIVLFNISASARNILINISTV